MHFNIATFEVSTQWPVLVSATCEGRLEVSWLNARTHTRQAAFVRHSNQAGSGCWAVLMMWWFHLKHSFAEACRRSDIHANILGPYLLPAVQPVGYEPPADADKALLRDHFLACAPEER